MHEIYGYNNVSGTPKKSAAFSLNMSFCDTIDIFNRSYRFFEYEK